MPTFSATQGVPDQAEKCRLCRCRLGGDENDDLTHGLCGSCKSRPEARRLGFPLRAVSQSGAGATQHQKSAREFTTAEKGLIGKVHGYMPAPQLLDILNERLACDLGPDAMPYAMEQLFAEIGDTASPVPAGGHDWASLRKLLAQARRSGVLDAITAQVIDDFAVVFSLNPKQVLGLKDVLLQPGESE